MPKHIEILNTEISIEETGNFPTRMWLEIEDDQTNFSVHFKIFDQNAERAREGVLCDFYVPFRVTNPLDGGFILYIASKYGLCVAFKMGRFTIEKGISDDKIWTETYPDSPITERADAVALKFKEDAQLFRDEISRTVRSCVTLGLWPFNRGENGPNEDPPDV